MNRRIFFLYMGIWTLGNAQAPYHEDFTDSKNEQATRVRGNLHIEQYPSSAPSFGGDLEVIGGTFLSKGGVPIPNLPSNVTQGLYYGPLAVGPEVTGNGSYVSKIILKFFGNRTTADGKVFLGSIRNHGGPIEILISSGKGDYTAGSAYYQLGGVLHTSGNRPVIATQYSAIAGGERTQILASSMHARTNLVLKYDHHDIHVRDLESTIEILIRHQGKFEMAGNIAISEIEPVKIMNSTIQHLHNNSGSYASSSAKISADSITLDGKLTLSQLQGDISMGIYAD